MLQMVAFGFLSTIATTQTSNAPVTFAFHGIGSSDGGGNFFLFGTVAFAPYGERKSASPISQSNGGARHQRLSLSAMTDLTYRQVGPVTTRAGMSGSFSEAGL